MNKIKQKEWIPSLATALLCAGTFCLYIPAINYLTNVNQFSFGLQDLLLGMLLPFFCLSAVLIVLLVLVSRLYSDHGQIMIRATVLGLLLVFAIWLEGGLLGKNLPQITGEKDLFSSVPRFLADSVIWLLIVLAGVYGWRIIAGHLRFAFLSISMLLGLGLADAKLSSEPKVLPEINAETILDEMKFHQQDNVLVLVLDAMSTALVQEYLAEYPQTESDLDGFVFFINNMEASSSTQWSLPSILKGEIYTGGEVLEYQENAYSSPVSMAQKFKTNGYDIYATSILPIFNTIDLQDQDRQISRQNSLDVSLKLYGQLFVRFAPYALKNPIANQVGFNVSYGSGKGKNGGNLAAVPDRLRSNHDAAAYLALMHAADAAGSPRPTFQFHHVTGAHAPYIFSENGEPLPSAEAYTYYGLQQQSRWTLHNVMELLAAMKSAGSYNSSTIVLLGDHGDRLIGESRSNQAYAGHASLLIKPANSHGPLTISTAPTSNLYLADILPQIHFGEASLAELTTDLPQQRMIYYGDKSEMNVFEGDDITTIKMIDSYQVKQTYKPTILKSDLDYSLGWVHEERTIGYPLFLDQADFSNGWGIKLLSGEAETAFLADAKPGDTLSVSLLLSTAAVAGGTIAFEPYHLIVTDQSTGQQYDFTITDYKQQIVLDQIKVSAESSIRFGLTLDAVFGEEVQYLLSEIKISNNER